MEKTEKEEKKEENGLIKWIHRNPICFCLMFMYTLGTASTIIQAIVNRRRG